jgi:hypothetical protein
VTIVGPVIGPLGVLFGTFDLVRALRRIRRRDGAEIVVTETPGEREIGVRVCLFLIGGSIVASAIAIWFLRDQGVISIALWCAPGIVGFISGLILLPAAVRRARVKGKSQSESR